MKDDPRLERKLGRRILALLEEMRTTPHTNMARFLVVKRQLERATEEYKEKTGRDRLDSADKYGYIVS